MLISIGTQNKDYQKSNKHQLQIWKKKKQKTTNKMQGFSYMQQTGLFCSKVIKIINRKLYAAEG